MRLQALYKQRTGASQVVTQTLGAVTTWVRSLPADTLADVEPPAVPLGKGEDLLGAIKKYRVQADALRARLKEIARAPITQAMAKQRMREEVEQHAQRRPNVASLLNGGKITWPMSSTQTQIYNIENGRPPIGFTEGVDMLGLLAAVPTLKKELASYLDNLITEQASSDGLTDEERTKQTKDTSDRLLATERIICALIERARVEWLPVDYTHELSPLAILSVVRVAAPPVERGTTPGYSWLLKR